MQRDLATLTAGLVALTLGGCASRCPPPAAPVPAASTPPVRAPDPPATPRAPALGAAIDPALPLCDDLLRDLDEFGGVVARGQPCRGVGVLVRHNFTSKGDRVIAAWPVIVLADGDRLMLESIWLRDTGLPPATIAALEGGLVEVAGVLHDQPPGSIQNWVHMPTLAPVTAIRAVAGPLLGLSAETCPSGQPGACPSPLAPASPRERP